MPRSFATIIFNVVIPPTPSRQRSASNNRSLSATGSEFTFLAHPCLRFTSDIFLDVTSRGLSGTRTHLRVPRGIPRKRCIGTAVRLFSVANPDTRTSGCCRRVAPRTAPEVIMRTAERTLPSPFVPLAKEDLDGRWTHRGTGACQFDPEYGPII